MLGAETWVNIIFDNNLKDSNYLQNDQIYVKVGTAQVEFLNVPNIIENFIVAAIFFLKWWTPGFVYIVSL